MIHPCSSRGHRGSWQCLFSGQEAERWSIPFLTGILVIQTLLCSQGQCRIQWKEGKIWIRNGEHGNGEELGCVLAITLGKGFVSLCSPASQKMLLSSHSTQKAVTHCHVASTSLSYLWGVSSVTGFCKREYFLLPLCVSLTPIFFFVICKTLLPDPLEGFELSNQFL